MKTIFQITNYPRVFFILRGSIHACKPQIPALQGDGEFTCTCYEFLVLLQPGKKMNWMKSGWRKKEKEPRKKEKDKREVKGSRCGFLLSNIFLHSHVKHTWRPKQKCISGSHFCPKGRQISFHTLSNYWLCVKKNRNCIQLKQNVDKAESLGTFHVELEGKMLSKKERLALD